MKRRKRTLWNTTIKDQVGLPKELANTVINKDDLSELIKRAKESAASTREQFNDHVKQVVKEREEEERVARVNGSYERMMSRTYNL